MTAVLEPASPWPEVLVVDDNPATRYSTGRVLQAAGFRVREAGTGAEALHLTTADVGAVILDVHLPDIDGFDVCRRLRARPETARVPVIYLSAAYVQSDDKVRGLHSGADAYMTHPVEPPLLVATVQALVRARHAEDAMRRSEARFKAIYEHAPSGICLIDGDGVFLEVNPALLRWLGREQDAVIGRRVADLAPPEWAPRIAEFLGRSEPGVHRGEFPLLDAQASLVNLEWSLTAHVEPGIRMAIATDVSERAALLQQREQLLEREQAARTVAERLSRTKDEFIAVLSHELRTPLNAILGWVHVLQQAGGAANLPRGLEAIERNARTQTRLISDILDVSRLDLGKVRLETESLDAAELVRSAVSTLSASIDEKQLHVAVDTTGVSRPIVADPARLQQVVWNLLTNAIKFSERGGRIGVTLSQDENSLVLTVQDEGRGIPANFLPYLFDRFSQSDSASNRHHGGLGLGLSIVQHLVELHGGTVHATSAGPGRGATFVVVLPSHTPPVEAAHQDSDSLPEEAVPPRPAAGLNGLTVLLVEDDADAREMFTMILRDWGANVVRVADAPGALAHLAVARPDVLISDVGLPGMDGYALMREVRSRERQAAASGEAAASRHLPAVALTAFTRPDDRDAAHAAGFDAHCPKPMQPGQLIGAILRVAGKAR